MQKKYITGVIYLCTLGICGIGWMIDIIIAFVAMLKGKQPEGISQTQNTRISSGGRINITKQLIKSFDTVIVGTFAKCDLDRGEKREDVIMRIRPKDELYLEFWHYKGEPAYYVWFGGCDAGCVRAGLAKILYEEYSDCEIKVTALDRTLDNRGECLTYNIRIDIYR